MTSVKHFCVSLLAPVIFSLSAFANVTVTSVLAQDYLQTDETGSGHFSEFENALYVDVFDYGNLDPATYPPTSFLYTNSSALLPGNRFNVPVVNSSVFFSVTPSVVAFSGGSASGVGTDATAFFYSGLILSGTNFADVTPATSVSVVGGVYDGFVATQALDPALLPELAYLTPLSFRSLATVVPNQSLSLDFTPVLSDASSQEFFLYDRTPNASSYLVFKTFFDPSAPRVEIPRKTILPGHSYLLSWDSLTAVGTVSYVSSNAATFRVPDETINCCELLMGLGLVIGVRRCRYFWR